MIKVLNDKQYQPRNNKSFYTLQVVPGSYTAGVFFNPMPGVQFASEAAYGLTPNGPQAGK